MQSGIVLVYLGNKKGNYYSIFVSIYWIGAGGCRIPLRLFGKSDVCDNNFSYCIMVLLTLASIGLCVSTIQKMIKKEPRVPYNKVETSI